MLPHVLPFLALALGVNRAVAIPSYMLVTGGLLVVWNAIDASRLNAFLKERYPAELAKLSTQTGYGYNSLRSLRFAFSDQRDEDPILERVRRHARSVWLQTLTLPPLMMIVVISAVSMSK